MKFKVILQTGIIYNEVIDYAIITNEDGEIGILKNHIPIILTAKLGSIKIVFNELVMYVIIKQAIIEFRENVLTILATEAMIGNSLKEAKMAFSREYQEKINLSKKENVDYSEKERELRDSIIKSKVGSL